MDPSDWTGKSPRGFNPHRELWDTRVTLGVRETVIPGEEHTIAVQCQMAGPEDIQARDIVRPEQAILGIYVIYKYTFAIAVSKSRSHEFEGGWAEVYGRIWRGEREGRNVIKYNLKK